MVIGPLSIAPSKEAPITGERKTIQGTTFKRLITTSDPLQNISDQIVSPKYKYDTFSSSEFIEYIGDKYEEEKTIYIYIKPRIDELV